ncbi:hypothetical protein BJV82DRAFT_90160 [Fennellomyces sp. T-0311]|nr:hypothetical protein BJV82DRAFT_90160 [Fennellomyces sp. T-0311]
MKLSLRYLIAILILLHRAESQLSLGLGGGTDPQSSQAAASPSPSDQQPQPSSVAPPPPHSSDNSPAPSNSAAPQPTKSDNSQPTPAPSSSDNEDTPTSRRHRKTAADSNDTTQDSTPTSQPSPTDQPSADGGGLHANKQTAIIAGSVVGGVVIFALLGGCITFLNRRGGCTRPRRRRANNDYAAQPEDFSIDMNETNSQYARRFVPPNSPAGYVNLQDHPQDVQYYHAQTSVAPAPVWTVGAKPDAVEYKPNEA